MPTIDLHYADHLIFLLLAVVFPLYGRHRFHALRAATAAGQSDARIRAYRVVLVEEWLSTAAVAAVWWWLSREISSLGLSLSTHGLALAGYGLTLALVALLLFQTRVIATNVEARQKARGALEKLLDLIPHDSREKSMFGVVAVTAGICEEFLYRGFLLAYLASWMPQAPTGLVVAAGGAVFGVAHLYQGWAGVLKTGALGVLMGVLYWMTGSIWASVVLHAMIDLNSGWIGWRVLQDPSDDAVADPLPA